MELNQEPNLEISIKELSHIFPFCILFSNELKVEFYGKSIYHLYPNIQKNDDFFTHWEIIRPWVETCDAETIETLTGKLVVICNRSKPSLKFKGQFERIQLENKYIFIGSPWFNDSDQLIENNLSIGDFAFHDSTIDLLHVLKNNEIANFELREILQRINDQKQLLLKEQTTLLNKERMLQGLSESTEILISNNTDSLLLEEAFSKIGASLDLHKIVLFKSENEKATAFKAWSFEPSMHKSFSIIHPNQKELKKNTTLEITNTSNSPTNEFSTYLEEQKANSVLTIPVFIKNAFWGYIEFIDIRKERNWSTDEKRILKIFSNCIASTIENRENAAEIYNMALFPLENTDPVIRINKNGNVLLRNKASEKLNYLVVANKKRSETVLFKYLANTLKKENREIIFEGKFDQLYYQANARLTNNNQNINIYLTNITKQKETEKELEKALSLSEGVSKAKEAFLINMSHEIRTPLNGIIGMIRELDKEEKTVQQKKYIDSAKSASAHLLSMVNNILDLSKIEAGELILSEEEINFQAIIKDIQKIVSNHTNEKGLKLEVKISSKINKSLTGDKTRIQQIILNILNNAIKFTAKGFVKIECDLLKSENEKQIIRVKITDSGIGMKKEYIPKLFTKFQQEDSSTSRMHGGTGLGMVITKQLIDLLHGEISVKSQKNIGTEITLELPFNLFKGESILPLKNKQNIKSLKNLKILIVEDNEMNRMVAKNALTLFAPKITEAENGKEAISILKRESFDIVLMDLQMPIMGGIEATKIIRNELKISTPIIALSANAFKTEIEKCLANGMSSYVTKPFEEKDLIDAICKEMGATYTSKTEDKKSVFTKKSALYSTKNLMNVSGNDVEFIVKMLKLFIQITPDLIVKLEDAFQNKDISTIQKTAHYIKPTIDNLEIDALKEDIRALESLHENFNENKNLAALIEKTTKTLALVVQEMIENEFK